MKKEFAIGYYTGVVAITAMDVLVDKGHFVLGFMAGIAICAIGVKISNRL